MNAKPGWQQPAVPTPAPRCPHLGVLVAMFTLNQHKEGHEWVCVCGQAFIVVSNGGKDKRLVPRGR